MGCTVVLPGDVTLLVVDFDCCVVVGDLEGCLDGLLDIDVVVSLEVVTVDGVPVLVGGEVVLFEVVKTLVVGDDCSVEWTSAEEVLTVVSLVVDMDVTVVGFVAVVCLLVLITVVSMDDVEVSLCGCTLLVFGETVEMVFAVDGVVPVETDEDRSFLVMTLV